MGWVDTHCHLQLDDRPPEQLLEAAATVDWIVAPGVDLDSSQASFALAARFPAKVLPTTGLHPHDADKWPAQEEAIAGLAPGAAAIGETGLDYYRNLSPRAAQRQSFLAQIELATALDKPLIVHCRDAFADVLEMISASGLGSRVVLHCWTGGPRWTRRFIETGATFSFAGPVAFETGDTVRLGAAIVPPDRVMVETDTPYLAPPPHRQEPNQPAWVPLVGAALARVWSLPLEEVERLTTARARAVFGHP
jgi:TatD DNase family protein